MLKLDNSRIHFPLGEQKSIIEKALTKSRLTIDEFADLLKVSPRTLRDWRREKYHITYRGLNFICKKANIEFPDNIEIHDAYSYTKKAGKLGSIAVIQKYGKVFPCDPRYRQKQWRKWWNEKGKFNPPPQTKPIPVHKPKHSAALAEFIGIMIGDGGISKRQITITLNSTDDHEYSIYIQNLCEKLFKVKPSVYYRTDCNVVNIVISRSNLVTYLQTLGLGQGDKIRYGVTIPDWIMCNETYLKRCLRGIFDTDGGLFLETHKIKKREYSYIRLAFVSASKPLIEAVLLSLTRFQFHPKIRSGKRVQLENRDEILQYFKIIKTSNPKHQKRLEKFVGKTIK